MNNTNKRFNPVPLIIVSAAVIVLAVFIFAIYSLTNFRVYTNLSDSKKKDLASIGNAPQIADYIERYGERGPLDINYQIETCTFASLDDLDSAVTGVNEAVNNAINAVLDDTTDPETNQVVTPSPSKIEQAVLNGTTTNARDLKGKKVKAYLIESYSPSTDKKTTVESSSQEYYWNWTYSVYEYPDGTYRYVINVQTS